MGDMDTRRGYTIGIIVIWSILLFGLPLAAALVIFAGIWWAALPWVALIFSLQEIWKHFTGYERHMRYAGKPIEPK
jgi:hypothetical protein